MQRRRPGGCRAGAPARRPGLSNAVGMFGVRAEGETPSGHPAGCRRYVTALIFCNAVALDDCEDAVHCRDRNILPDPIRPLNFELIDFG